MNNEHIRKAIETVNHGGIIIFPTDTAFGIGCRIDIPSAVDRLFEIRKRPLTQATPVLVSSRKMALQYFRSPNIAALSLMDTYWPGALTVVSTCDPVAVYARVRGDGNTIGLRMPNHDVILSIIERAGVPILGPSANFHGEETPYYFESLNPELVKLVDYIVPGECSIKHASTVVDCSVDPYIILRHGAIDLAGKI